METVWYRNTETDVAWEIEKGSPLEKRLKKELTADDERLYERESAPAAEKATEPTRAQLDAQALEAGITEPEKLPNKQAVIDAIAAAKAAA